MLAEPLLHLDRCAHRFCDHLVLPHLHVQSRPCFFSFSEIVLDRIFLAAVQHVHTHLLKDSTSKRLLTDRKDVHFCLELQLVELASQVSNPKLPQSISNANSLAC